jgi:cell division protease FtsH
MVGRWGMSEAIGPVTVLPPPGQASPLLSDGNGPSQSTRELVDKEVRRIVDECYTQAVASLREHRSQLDSLAHKLLERETLDEADAYAAAGIKQPRHVPTPVPAQTAARTSGPRR